MIVQDIPLDDLIRKYPTKESNPNRMSAERYKALVALLQEVGFTQPILVRKAGAKYELIDGHHRLDAAVELKRPTIPACIITASDAVATGLSVGMNRIRGEVSLSVVADILRELSEALEGDTETASVLSGFSMTEVEALVARADSGPELSDMVSVSEPMEEERVEKPHVLEISFANVELYKTVRRKLKKAAGKGGDLARGLMTVLGIDEEDLT